MDFSSQSQGIMSRMFKWLDRPAVIAMFRLASAGLSLVTAPIVARTLGPAGRGQTATIVSILLIAPIMLGAGVPIVVRRRALTSEGAAKVTRVARVISPLCLLPALLIAIIALHTVLGDLPTYARVLFLVAAAFGMPATIQYNCDSNVLFAQGRNLEFAFSAMLPVLVQTVLVIFGAFVNIISVGYFTCAILAGNIISLAYTSWRIKIPFRGERDGIIATLKDGTKFGGAQFADAASRRLDQVIAIPIVGATQAGFYSVAASISLITMALGQAVAAVAFRRVSAANDTGNDQEAIVVESGKVIRETLVLTALVAILLVATTPTLVPLMFGVEFQPAIAPTIVALLGSVGVVLGFVGSSMLSALDKGWAMTTAQVSGLVIGIALAFFMGSRYLAIGLAAASSIGYWIAAIWCLTALPVKLRHLAPRFIDLTGAVRSLVTVTEAT